MWKLTGGFFSWDFCRWSIGSTGPSHQAVAESLPYLSDHMDVRALSGCIQVPVDDEFAMKDGLDSNHQTIGILEMI